MYLRQLIIGSRRKCRQSLESNSANRRNSNIWIWDYFKYLILLYFEYPYEIISHIEFNVLILFIEFLINIFAHIDYIYRFLQDSSIDQKMDFETGIKKRIINLLISFDKKNFSRDLFSIYHDFTEWWFIILHRAILFLSRNLRR